MRSADVRMVLDRRAFLFFDRPHTSKSQRTVRAGSETMRRSDSGKNAHQAASPGFSVLGGGLVAILSDKGPQRRYRTLSWVRQITGQRSMTPWYETPLYRRGIGAAAREAAA
jgi:hypothetical protein